MEPQVKLPDLTKKSMKVNKVKKNVKIKQFDFDSCSKNL